MVTRVVSLLVLTCSVGAVAAHSQTPTAYDSVAPAELLMRSWRSPSAYEKAVIRHYLSQRYPEKAEGQFAKAWLAIDAGKTDEGTRYYRAAIAIDPDHAPSLLNGSGNFPYQDAVKALERQLEIDPAFDHYSGIRYLYFRHLSQGDTARATQFLATWQQRLPGHFIFPYIRGIQLENQRKWADAEQVYLEAVRSVPRDFRIYRSLVHVRLNHLSTPDTPRRADLLAPVFDYARATGDWYQALFYVGEQIRDVFKSDITAYDYFVRAFKAYPTGEAADAALDTRWANVTPDLLEFLNEANRILPNNSLVLSSLGMAVLFRRDDPAAAEALLQRAIQHAYTPATRQKVTRNLGRFVYEGRLHTFDRAEKLYREQYSEPALAEKLEFILYENKLFAGEFDAALKHLREHERLLRLRSGVNEAVFRGLYNALDRYRRAEYDRKRYYAENPFLTYWQRLFGDSLTVVIGFARNSAALTPASEELLVRVGRMLNEPGASSYIFSIDGYADESEADRETLAEQRARAVMDHLYERHGVPLGRMQTAHADGAKRVEIMPLGNLTQPTVSVTSTLPTDGVRRSFALSPNGRYAATGMDPIQLWDLRRGARVRDLGMGATRYFSPNGRYLAATSSYRDVGGIESFTLFIYDVKTGQAIAQVPSRTRLGDVAWSPSSREITFSDNMGVLTVYDVAAQRRVRTKRMGPRLNTAEVLWTWDGRHIVTGQAMDDVVRIHDAKTLEVLRTLEGVSWPHALAQTRDGRYLIAADNKRVLSVYTMDWAKPEWVPSQISIPPLAFNLSVHPTLPRVVITDFGRRAAPYDQIVVDVQTMKIVAQSTSGIAGSAFYSPDGRRIIARGVDQILTLDAETLDTVGVITGLAGIARAGGADVKAGYFLSSDDAGIHVWDVQTGKRVHAWADRSELLDAIRPGVFMARTKPYDKHVFTTELALYNTTDFKSSTLTTVPIRVDSWSVDGDRIALGGISESHEQYTIGRVIVVDARTGKVLHDITLPLQTTYMELGQADDGGVATVRLLPGAMEVAVATFWQDGFGRPRTYSRQARLFSLGDGQLRATITVDWPVYSADYHNGQANEIVVGMQHASEVYDRSTARYLRSLPTGSAESTITWTGGSLIWAGNGIRLAQGDSIRSIASVYPLKRVEVFPERRLIVALNEANDIGFFDLQGNRQLSIANKRAGEWIAYAPTGEFVTSLLGAERVFWSLGDRMLPFEELRSKFERPGLIAERLRIVATGDSSPNAKASAALSSSAPQLEAELFGDPYVVQLETAREVETPAETVVVEFTVQRRHQQLPEPTLVFRQQGLELSMAHGLEGLTKTAAADGTWKYRRVFRLADGLNVIDIGYGHGGAQRLAASLRVHRTQSAAQAGRPRLWFLGIGTRQYALEQYNLKYADKDVVEVARLLEQQRGRLYEDVRTKLLLNDSATNDNIKNALYEFLGQAAAHDVVVVYLAGHGRLSTDQSVYYMTHNADLAKPWQGYALREFHQFLKNRPPTQKALFFMDICHAGAFGGGSRSFVTGDDAVRELIEGTGLIVFASSTGQKASLEGPQYRGGHGAFTAAVLEALEGRASADGDWVRVTELQTFVSRRVPEITMGQQQPMTPLVEGLRDFPLIKLREGIKW